MATSSPDVLISSLNAALNAGQYTGAIDLLTKALASEPKNAALHQSRGAVHLIRLIEWPEYKSGGEKQRKASRDRAVKDLDQALKLDPLYAEAYLTRALAHRGVNDAKRALADFNKALDLGLEPPFEIQAYNYRSSVHPSNSEALVADIATVNAMRKKNRGLGDAWRENYPQRASLRSTVPAPTAAVPRAPVKAAKALEPAAVVASFQKLTEAVLSAKEAPALRKLHEKIEKLDLLESSDEPAHGRAITRCVKQLRAHRKNLSELAARELDNILDTVTDS